MDIPHVLSAGWTNRAQRLVTALGRSYNGDDLPMVSGAISAALPDGDPSFAMLSLAGLP